MWDNVRGPKRGKCYEFGVKKNKKTLFSIYQKIDKSILKNAARCPHMLSSSSIHEIDDSVLGEASASTSKKTLWRGEESKLSKEDEKGKMGRALINDETKRKWQGRWNPCK